MKLFLTALCFICFQSIGITQEFNGRWEMVKVETEDGKTIEELPQWIDFIDGRSFYIGDVGSNKTTVGGEWVYDKTNSELILHSAPESKHFGRYTVSALTEATGIIEKSGRKIYLERVSYKVGNIDADATWKYQFESGYPNRNPSLDDEHIYFGSDMTPVKCLDRKTGELIWTSVAKVGSKGFFHTMAQDDESIYINGTQGIIYKINKEDGKVLWQKECRFDDDILNKITLLNDILYVNPYDSVFLALNTDGEEVWKTKLPTLIFSYTISDGEIYGNIGNGELVVLDALSGKIVHQKLVTKKSRFFPEPFVSDKTVIVSHTDGVLKAYDLQLKMKWSNAKDNYFRFYQVGDALVVMQKNKMLRLNPENGALIWEYTVGDLQVAPTFFEGNIYVQGRDDFSILDVETGDLMYVSLFKHKSFMQPIVTRDEMILGYSGTILRIANPLGE
ncbi:MAG: outer membrane protein assembly factor BamB [Crocinitomicaceae bacterium]|jgi:outer membrane protein assembly factor BamB